MAVVTSRFLLRRELFHRKYQVAASSTTRTNTTTPTTTTTTFLGRRFHNSGDDSLRTMNNNNNTNNSNYKLPKRIILIRHGESLGNADDTAYETIPDWQIPITRRGERQANHAGEELHKLIQGESLFTYCSPYKRTLETWEIMKEHLEVQGGVNIVGMRQEPRIVEQQFGNFQNPKKVRTAKAERRTFGRFFFRFPNGEAGLDVYNRVSSFLATLARDLQGLSDHQVPMDDLNVLIVTHGLTLRLLLMRYFQLSVDEFEHSYNSQNAKLVIMDRITEGQDTEFFRLDETSKEALNLQGEVSSEKPSFWRGDRLDLEPYDEGS